MFALINVHEDVLGEDLLPLGFLLSSICFPFPLKGLSMLTEAMEEKHCQDTELVLSTSKPTPSGLDHASTKRG